ncbi:hypothetical protein [Undibacterium sp.]|uniref:hypothetical protein n=1 Tax=Undibacterium sp. TaxID=1914977 RepID=UPI00374CB355
MFDIKMQLAFLIECTISHVSLFELSDGRFQILESGRIGPFLSGPGYLLVENELASFLQGLQLERLIYESAILFERSTGTEYRTHTRIRVGQFFKPDQINDLALSGPRLLTMGDEHYFVSEYLKLLLEDSDFNYLSFSEGLGRFAG